MTSPIRVDQDTDDRITHAARLLGVSKKALVADAVRAYVAQKAPQLDEGLRHVAELLAPSNIVVTSSTMGSIAALIVDAPEPAPALRELRDA